MKDLDEGKPYGWLASQEEARRHQKMAREVVEAKVETGNKNVVAMATMAVPVVVASMGR